MGPAGPPGGDTPDPLGWVPSLKKKPGTDPPRVSEYLRQLVDDIEHTMIPQTGGIPHVDDEIKEVEMFGGANHKARNDGFSSKVKGLTVDEEIPSNSNSKCRNL